MSQSSHNSEPKSVPMIHYFGYGSLVNRDTRPAAEPALNATLNGFQRIWNHRVGDGVGRSACTALSVVPAPGGIDGVLVSLPESELAALDAREQGYERLLIAADQFHLPEGYAGQSIYVYRSLAYNQALADEAHPIAKSYIDCVMAGYLQRFGRVGLQRFVQSTRGWEGCVRQDRQQPTYPRHVPVSDELCAVFDALLA